MTNAQVSDKVYFVQGLRRSNAAVAVPARKVRREVTRKDQRRAAVSRSLRGE